MGKILVLAEKPSVGKELARVLNCNNNGNGYFEGSKYIVTWALGHLVTLASPDTYDKKYKSWRMEDLPMIPQKMQLVIIKKTSKQFNVVKKLMTRNDIKELVLATDAGREGELVGRWIIEKAKFRKPIKRLWISSQTDKAIKEGFKNLKPGIEYENLYKSAVCRAEADWLVGLNVTRALTCKYNTQLSAGRVQTPTLAMIIQREDAINNFIPRDYYIITGNAKCANANSYTLQWQHSDSGKNRIFNNEEAKKIVSKVDNQNGKIIEVKKAYKKKSSPLLYDLTELQRDANKKFGYSAKQTLSIMQRLYENHKILTYPRTDSRYITTDIVPTLSDRLKKISIYPYSKFTSNLLKSSIKGNKNFVDNSKVSDHHAIIPTEQKVNISLLSIEEKNIYDLVIRRFLSVLYPPYEYEQITVKASINGETFIAKGKNVKHKGWKSIYDKDELLVELDNNNYNNEDTISDQFLPDISKDDKIKLTGVKTIKRQTKPPARFTEGTLLSAMENPQKYIHINDKQLEKTIGKAGGIGTVATRADIIEKLFNSYYIEKKGKEIIPTSKGKQLISLVPSDLKSPLLTAEWEQQLYSISKGKLNSTKFINDMKKYASKLVLDVTNNTKSYRHDNLTREKCPNCGKYLLEVNTKKGKMLICQDRECGYRKNIAKVTNARCPQCHKKLALVGKGEGQIFVCSTCGYREKLSSFNKRKKAEGSKLSKREVTKYIRQQKKENKEPINSALADALANLKIK
ncbi:DNA topoisomerase III [Clostridium tepidiprofundi]|nr:DNA topoisomerase III [Clostridium tepidiprofundi]